MWNFTFHFSLFILRIVQGDMFWPLRNVGVSTGDFDADLETNDEIEDSEELDDFGDLDVAGPVGGSASTAAGSVEGAGEVGPV